MCTPVMLLQWSLTNHLKTTVICARGPLEQDWGQAPWHSSPLCRDVWDPSWEESKVGRLGPWARAFRKPPHSCLMTDAHRGLSWLSAGTSTKRSLCSGHLGLPPSMAAELPANKAEVMAFLPPGRGSHTASLLLQALGRAGHKGGPGSERREHVRQGTFLRPLGNVCSVLAGPPCKMRLLLCLVARKV